MWPHPPHLLYETRDSLLLSFLQVTIRLKFKHFELFVDINTAKTKRQTTLMKATSEIVSENNKNDCTLSPNKQYFEGTFFLSLYLFITSHISITSYVCIRDSRFICKLINKSE